MHMGEFLKLLQMTEGVRVCVGDECMEIDEALIRRAEDGARAADLHDERGCDAEAPGGGCVGCDAVRTEKIALREHLHAQGLDFPFDVTEG